MQRVSRIVAIVLVALAMFVPSAQSTVAVDADEEEQNCAAFTTQAEAQAWFMAHGGSKTNNVDFLDADHDGIACEHLSSASGSASGSAPGTEQDDRPWRVAILAVIGVAMLGGIGGALVTLVRKRQATASDVATTPFVAIPEVSPTEIPCDPPPPGWPTVNETRATELAALPEGAYLATPEWQQRAEAILRVTGGRCQLCNADLMLPDQVRHRTTERRGRELPCDLIVLCDRCAAQLGITTNER